MNNDSFFSIDRLVEFGMSMAMAQQMVRVMNESMQSMYVPGSIQSMPAARPRPLHVAVEGQAIGPLTDAEFSHLVAQRRVTPQSLVWMPGMVGWKPLEQVPEALRIVALAPPPLP